MVLRVPAPESLKTPKSADFDSRSWDALLRLAAEYAAVHHLVPLFESSLPMRTTVSLKDPGSWEMGPGIVAIPDMRELHGALADLDRLDDEAKEAELPAPVQVAVENARTLLPALYAIHAVRYQVSPTERGGVSIDPPMKPGKAVSIECGPDGSVYCFAAIAGNGRRAKFYQMEGLPDGFVEKALRDLARE